MYQVVVVLFKNFGNIFGMVELIILATSGSPYGFIVEPSSNTALAQIIQLSFAAVVAVIVVIARVIQQRQQKSSRITSNHTAGVYFSPLLSLTEREHNGIIYLDVAPRRKSTAN